PISGTIVDVNESLFDNPEIINKEPYGKGWIMKVKLSDKNELKELMNANQIIEWVKKRIDKS
ncbi:glycine cleavage system protein H, partial [Candidatus Woesearchaeota archaeon ex4484_78]